MSTRKRDLTDQLARAIERWVDRDGNLYRDAYVLGTGGEGTTIVAERIPKKRPARDPATSHVVIKLPVVVDGPSNGEELQCDDTRFDRIRAEHRKREALGNAPHMSQTPEMLELTEAELEGVRIRYREIDQQTLEEKDMPLAKPMPILRTPLSRPRGGAMVPVSLDRLTPQYGCWSSRELLNWTMIVRAVGRALWSIHGRGWAHGDIKPQNVVLYESRSRWHDVQLIDFGLVHPSFPGALERWGSYSYFRPERLKARRTGKYPPGLTPATEDLFALGTMLAEILLGSKVTEELHRIARRKADPETENASRYSGMLRRRMEYELRPDAYLFDAGPGGHFAKNEYRVAAFRLCDRLLRWPDADRSTIDVLRDLLAAVDIRLVGVGDPETMFTKLLVGLGAMQPGDQIRATRTSYRSLDPKGELPQLPGTTEEVSSFIEQEVEAAIEWLRRGRGAMAERHLKRLVEWAAERPLGQPWLPDAKSAYELCQGLRLYCGIILVRERMLGRSRRLLDRLDRFPEKWPHPHGTDKLVQWWVTHLKHRLTLLEHLHHGRGSLASLEESAKAPAPDRPTRTGEAMRAWDAAERWCQSLLCDIALSHPQADERNPEVEELKKVQDKRESSHEAAYGAIQLMRAYGRLAQQQLAAILDLIQLLSPLPQEGLDGFRNAPPDLLEKLFQQVAGEPRIFDLIEKLPDLQKAVEPELLARFPSLGAFPLLVQLFPPLKAILPRLARCFPGLREMFPALVDLMDAAPLALGQQIAAPADQDRKAPPGIVDSLWEAVYKFLLAVGWTIAGPMPHENALALRHAAAIILDLFTLLEQITDEIRRLLVGGYDKPPKLDQQMEPYLTLFLIPKAHISVDVEAGLLGAASAALAAADAYRDLHVVPSATSSFVLAGKCYLKCASAEHVLDGLMWLSFAKNDLILWREGGGPKQEEDQKRDPFDPDRMIGTMDSEIEKGIARWVEAADRAYAGTGGHDPGSFVGRLFFGRHGVEIARLTGETLAVDLVDKARRDTGPQPVSKRLPSPPARSSALERMLIKLVCSQDFEDVAGSFLELDCGLGANCQIAKALRLPRLPFNEVIGLDTMEWCVQEARQKTGDPRSYHRFSLHEEGLLCAEESLLQHGKYSVIWMHDTLCRVSHRTALLSHARSLLQETGYLIFTDWIQVRRAAQDEWRSLCLSAGLVSLETEHGYRAMLSAAGFEVLLMRRFDREMKAFFHAMTSSLEKGAASNAHARAAVAVLQAAQKFVANGPSGLDGFDAVAFETPVATPQDRGRTAAPAPGTDTVDPNDYHKDGFLGWLWVIARPKSRTAPPKPSSNTPPPTIPPWEGQTGKEREEARPEAETK